MRGGHDVARKNGNARAAVRIVEVEVHGAAWLMRLSRRQGKANTNNALI
jgi:hypothetical protein